MSGSTAQPWSRRSLIVAGVIAALVLVGAITAAVLIVLPAVTSGAPSRAATGEVGPDGFRIELAEGIVVSGDSDVAPAGTVVRAEIVEQDVPGDFGTFATPVAPVVDITLGDGLQPATPITLQFAFTADEAQSLQADRLFVLGESATDGRDVDFVEASWDNGTRTMTATLEHLSWYTVTRVDDRALGERMGEWINQQAGVRTPKPACVDEPIRPSGSYVLAEPWPDAAWVCARESADTVTVELTSNSGLVYEIRSRPDGEYAPLTALSASGVLTTLAHRYMEGRLGGDAILLPGGDMDITYDRPFSSARIELKIEPGLSQISSLTFGTSMLLPASWAERLDWYGCATDALETLTGASATRAVLSCVGAGIGGTAGALLGIVTAGPGLLFTQIEGLVKEARRQNVESFTVSLVAGDAVRELPQGASWLFEHAAGGQSTSGDEDIAEIAAAGDTVASYPFSTNQWVSCTREPAEARYTLGGDWRTLSLAPAVQAHAPEGLTATIEVIGDGNVLFSGEVARGAPLSRTELDVTGVEDLVVTAITASPCGSASKGYAALVQAYLR